MENQKPEAAAPADTLPDGVRIFAPDMSLKEKLGPNVSFDQVVSPSVIAAAQDVITRSADEILAATMIELEKLQSSITTLIVDAPGVVVLKPVIESAFAIKANAGLCGYPFASLLAKSLYVYCELDNVRDKPLTTKSIEIIGAQVAGLRTVFTAKIKGDGGAVGQAILGELQKIYKGAMN